MKPTTFIANITGLSFQTLFNPINGLVSLKADVNNNVEITKWNVPNVAQPTAAALAAALAAPEPVSQALLLAYSSADRATASAAGTSINVDPSAPTAKMVFASTDSESLTLLSGALQYVQLNPNAMISWHGNGITTQLSASEMAVLAQGVYAFIQSTFTTQATVAAEITNGTVTTYAQIDALYGVSSPSGPTGPQAASPTVGSTGSTGSTS